MKLTINVYGPKRDGIAPCVLRVRTSGMPLNEQYFALRAHRAMKDGVLGVPPGTMGGSGIPPMLVEAGEYRVVIRAVPVVYTAVFRLTKFREFYRVR